MSLNEMLQKQLVKRLLLPLLVASMALSAAAQPATSSSPFAVGTGSCGSGKQMIHYYKYNPNSNSLSSDLLLNCTPQLRIGGTPGGGSNVFQSSNASVAFNPRDQKLYYMLISSSAGVSKTYVWSWPAGSCVGTTGNRLDTMVTFNAFILGIVFDADGNGWLLEFSTGGAPYTPYIRSIDFATGVIGGRDVLAVTGGAQIYASGSGDITISPSGRCSLL